MKKEKLYSLVFPVWYLLMYPAVWIAILPINLLIDTIVLLIGFRSLKLNNIFEKYKTVIIKVWLFGIVSNIIGALLLTIPIKDGNSIYNNIMSGLNWGLQDNILSVLISIAISMILIYILNYKFSFKKLEIEKKNIKRLSLIIAIFTSPWMLLCPIKMVYNNINITPQVQVESHKDVIRDTLNNLEFSSYIQDGVYDNENLRVSINYNLASNDEEKLNEYNKLFKSGSTNKLLNKNAEKIFKKINTVQDIVFKVSDEKTYEFSRNN